MGRGEARPSADEDWVGFDTQSHRVRYEYSTDARVREHSPAQNLPSHGTAPRAAPPPAAASSPRDARATWRSRHVAVVQRPQRKDPPAEERVWDDKGRWANTDAIWCRYLWNKRLRAV